MKKLEEIAVLRSMARAAEKKANELHAEKKEREMRKRATEHNGKKLKWLYKTLVDIDPGLESYLVLKMGHVPCTLEVQHSESESIRVTGSEKDDVFFIYGLKDNKGVTYRRPAGATYASVVEQVMTHLPRYAGEMEKISEKLEGMYTTTYEQGDLEICVDLSQVDTDDPGQGTPVLVSYKPGTPEEQVATFNCALGEQEIGTHHLNQSEIEFLLSVEEEINQLIEEVVNE